MSPWMSVANVFPWGWGACWHSGTLYTHPGIMTPDTGERLANKRGHHQLQHTQRLVHSDQRSLGWCGWLNDVEYTERLLMIRWWPGPIRPRSWTVLSKVMAAGGRALTLASVGPGWRVEDTGSHARPQTPETESSPPAAGTRDPVPVLPPSPAQRDPRGLTLSYLITETLISRRIRLTEWQGLTSQASNQTQITETQVK